MGRSVNKKLIGIGLIAIVLALGAAAWLSKPPAMAPSLPPRTPQEAQLRQAVAKHPDDPEAVLGLVRYLEEADRRTDVVLALRDGMNYRPKEPAYLREFAQFYTDWGFEPGSQPKYEAAEQYWLLLSEVTDLAPTEWLSLGHVYGRQQRPRRALAVYKMALKGAPDDAFTKACVGWALLQLNRYEAAVANLEEARRGLPERSDVLRWLADAYLKVGRYADSTACCQAALAYAPEEERKGIEKASSRAEQLASEEISWRNAYVHAELGRQLLNGGRPHCAVRECEQALHLMPSEVSASSRSSAAWIWYTASDAYRAVEDRENEKKCILEAIPLYELLGKKSQLSHCYQDLALSLRSLAYKQSASKYELLEQALLAHQLERSYALEAGDIHMARHALCDYLFLLIALSGPSTPEVQEMRPYLVRELGENPNVLDCSFRVMMSLETDLRFCANNNIAAQRLCNLYEPITHPGSDRYARRDAISALDDMGVTCARLNDQDGYIRHFSRALDIVEEIRKTVTADEYRQTVYDDTLRRLAGGIVRANVIRGNPGAAFDAAERVKGRVLLDLLNSRPAVRIPQDTDADGPVLMAKAEDATLDAAGAGGEDHDQALRTLDVEPAPYEHIVEDTQDVQRAFPMVADAQSLTWEQVMDFDDEFTVVSYYVSDYAAYAMVLAPGAVDALQLKDVTPDKLRTLVDRFRREIGVKEALPRDLNPEPRADAPAAVTKPDTTAAQELYALLIKPIRPYFKTQLLYISPDDILNYLAFEALADESGRCLIDDYTVAYTPSASVLKHCLDENRHARRTLLAFGNPNLKNPAFRLYNAEEEVKTLQGLFPESRVLTTDTATETEALKQAGAYDVLHFACHGELNPDDPLLSCLRLTPDDTNDGYLHAGEIFGLKLSASLVVMSACNSGLGEVRNGNEVQGLTRAFFAAGAPAIVSSLWTVDDRSTAHLMTRFYENLEVMDKAEALRQAKLETRKAFPGAFHWAAFCLHGDYR